MLKKKKERDDEVWSSRVYTGRMRDGCFLSLFSSIYIKGTASPFKELLRRRIS